MDDQPICVRVSTELWYAIIPSRGFKRNVTLLHSDHRLVSLYLNLIDFRGSHAGKHFGQELRQNDNSPGTGMRRNWRATPAGNMAGPSRDT